MIRFRLPDDEFYKIGWTAYISQGQRRGFYSVGITVMISLAVGVNRSFVLRSLVLRSFIACLPDTYYVFTGMDAFLRPPNYTPMAARSKADYDNKGIGVGGQLIDRVSG